MSGVAVVIPCFNLGRTLADAVDSVLRQTRPADEIIVVDDGSTDLFTRQALARLPQPEVRVIRTENRGLSRTRNHGIELSQAPYVVLLDADDMLDSTYIEKTAGCLDANADVDIVSCALQAFEGADYLWTPNAELVTGIVKGSLHASSLFRRCVYDRIGGFDPALPAFEASEFWVRAMAHGFTVRILDEPLLKYRIRSDSKYHLAITGERFVTAREALLRKHQTSVEDHLEDILAETDAFLVDLEAHRRSMFSRRTALTAELDDVKAQHEHLGNELAKKALASLDWADLRTLTPLGNPASAALRKYYTSRFVAPRRKDITGQVLSDDPGLVRWLGVNVTGVSSLAAAAAAAPHSFDCVLLTRIEDCPDDIRTLLAAVDRVLRPGGVLMTVFPCVEPFATAGDGRDQWRFTESAVRRLLAERFPLDRFETESPGNVKTCVAALHGLDADQIDASSLNRRDPWFPLVICARAVKPAEADASAIAVRRGRSGAGVVLMYHRIATLPTDERHLCLDPAHFRRHTAHLRQHFHPMSLEDMARAARERTLPDRAVAVTIDDGYLDALTTAAPILAEWDIPATFFVNTLDLDAENEFWGDTLERIFFEEPVLPSTIELQLPNGSLKLPTGAPEERRLAWQAVSSQFYPLTASRRSALLRQVIDWTGLELPPRPSHRRMIGSEVIALASRPGHSIGSHTTHHLELTAHAADVQRWEMTDNKTRLEALLGRPVLTFAYPYGIHGEATIDAARAVPFVCAVTVKPGLVRAGADLLTLPRLEVPLADVDVFRDFLDRWFGDGATTR
jgi:glycosyltransferase involved in cell wall biosynthesis/peptidoglycan/xylan/chitin deacetylase (PgdA/CDA1 family)